MPSSPVLFQKQLQIVKFSLLDVVEPHRRITTFELDFRALSHVSNDFKLYIQTYILVSGINFRINIS